MTTIWKKVDSNCILCKSSVGKFFAKEGKIIVEKYNDNWGAWQKVKGKSEMNVICRFCQKKENKRIKKLKEHKQ